MQSMQVVACLSFGHTEELESAVSITGQDSMALLFGTSAWIVTDQGQITPFDQDFTPILLHNQFLLGTPTNKVVMVIFTLNKKIPILVSFLLFPSLKSKLTFLSILQTLILSGKITILFIQKMKNQELLLLILLAI